MDRRSFVKISSLASTAMFVPSFLHSFPLLRDGSIAGKKIVVIQLGGGNDGLNTVVPYGNDIYHQLRPQIRIRNEEVLKLNDMMGLHPNLVGLKSLYDDGLMSIVQGVGYPEPNRSHFRSMEIWQSGSASNEIIQTGWLGRYLDSLGKPVAQPHQLVELSEALSLAMKGENLSGIAMGSPRKLYQIYQDLVVSSITHNDHIHSHDHEHEQVGYLRKTLTDASSSVDYLFEKSKISSSNAQYPMNGFGQKLKSISELIAAGSSTKAYYVQLSGFDTHAGQKGKHARLLQQLGDGLKVFIEDLKANNQLDDTLVVCFSEFGRRVTQNAANGTDHGTANNVMIFGSQLHQPGLIGEAPDLIDLDKGDLKFKIDFRSIYKSILDDWFKIDSQKIITGNVAALNLCKAH